MRWLCAVLVVDLAIVAWLFIGTGHSQRADLVFASGSEHKFLDPQRLSWMHDIRVA